MLASSIVHLRQSSGASPGATGSPAAGRPSSFASASGPASRPTRLKLRPVADSQAAIVSGSEPTLPSRPRRPRRCSSGRSAPRAGARRHGPRRRSPGGGGAIVIECQRGQLNVPNPRPRTLLIGWSFQVRHFEMHSVKALLKVSAPEETMPVRDLDEFANARWGLLHLLRFLSGDARLRPARWR